MRLGSTSYRLSAYLSFIQASLKHRQRWQVIPAGGIIGGINSDTNPSDFLPFGRWLKQRRRTLDLTQAELARRATCATESIRKIEAGALKPSRALAQQIATVLAVPGAEQEAFITFARTRQQTAAADAFMPKRPPDDPRPAAASESPEPHALPRPLTSFVGREREVQAALKLLRRPDVALVTLSGPPGAGKTRLSLAVGQQLAGEFADGVCFVPLAAVGDAAMVLPAIAQALGVQDSTKQAPAVSVQRYLREKHLLLILDNFEQVVGAAPAVTELLAAAPRAKAMVSSRAVLKVYGEHELPVPPLAVPPTNPLPAVEVLATYSAVQLFMRRAQAVQPHAALTSQNAAAIAGICAVLDGLPLAIEMAAARMKWNEPETLLAQLRMRLSALSNEMRNLPARQRTVRGAIDWSYDLLPEDEQVLLRWLSVFVGGCTLEAVQEVTGSADSGPLLEAVAEKSLVQIAAPAGKAGRFTLLEIIRDYAREKLAAAGELNRAREQHLEYFMRWAESAAPLMTGAEQAAWYQRLEADHDNLRAAADWAYETHQAAFGLRLASPMWQFWIARGYEREWLERLLGLLALPEAQATDGASAQIRARGLNIAAFGEWQQESFAAARALLQEALALREVLNDPRSTAISLRYLGFVCNGEADTDGARACFEQSLEMMRGLNDRYEVAWSLAMLGDIALRQGDNELSGRQHGESAALLRELGNRTLLAYVTRRLGQLALRRADAVLASRLYLESLALNMDVHDRRGIAACLVGLANVAAATGRTEEAVRLLGAVAAVLAMLTAVFLPADQDDYERSVGSLRAAVAADVFEREWAAGKALTLEQAVSLAKEHSRSGASQ